MNNELLKVFIIDEPFPYAEMEILGYPLREHLKRSLFELEPVIVGCSQKMSETAAQYTAVLYSDMPLITAPLLYDLIDYMERQGHNSLSVGRGYICKSSLVNKADLKISFDSEECISALTPDRLSDVYRVLSRRNIKKAIDGGALILDPTAIFIDMDAVIESGAVIHPMVTIKGRSVIKSGALIRSGSVIENSIIGRNVSVFASFIYDSEIGENTTVGPCSLIRGGSEIGSNVRIGDFVEIKASKLGDGCKAAHLTYIGDAELGVSVNVGCGTVFANYNGKIKQKTYVGDHAFIGSNTNLVAPLKVGNYAYTAAGSTVTEDVPDNTLCIARARQVIKERKDK